MTPATVRPDDLADYLRAKEVRQLQVSGVIGASPFRDRLYKAELGVMPLHRPQEFENVIYFEYAATAPVLISPSQRYDILAGLVRQAKACMDGLQIILVRLCGPEFQIQLPAELLGDGVLLVHDPAPLAEELARSRPFGLLTIWQDLRTDGFDRGENRLVLTAYGPRCAAGLPGLVARSRVLSALDGLTYLAWPPRAADQSPEKASLFSRTA